jgi:broad specificity phosphatase PhoE
LSRTILILIRHGATKANLCRPYLLQGLRPDSELAPEGESQARAAAQALRHYPIVGVYASPLKRAWRTAELIAEPLHLPVVLEQGLVEADIGVWSDLSWPAIEGRWPDEYRAFHDNPALCGYPEGESLAQVRARVQPAVAKLVARHEGETIAVVSHGVVNRVLLATWNGMPLRQARRIPQDNAAFNIIELTGNVARVGTLNSNAHLAGLLPHAA